MTVRKLVNADVAESTRGLIPELLPGRSRVTGRSSSTPCTSRSAGAPRSRPKTAPRSFHGPLGVVEVPTMKVTAVLGYARHRGLADDRAARQRPGWRRWCCCRTSRWTSRSTLRVRVRQSIAVALSLPKVDVRAKFELSETLEQLGVGELFTPEADLTGLSPDRSLFVSPGDPRGRAAPRRTGPGGCRRDRDHDEPRGASPRKPADPIVVTVDRPFLLAVRHTRSKAVYFLAQVARP